MNSIGSLVGLVIWIVLIVDVAKPSTSAYEQAGTSKVLWIVLTVILGLIGWIIYALTNRSKVRAAAGM